VYALFRSLTEASQAFGRWFETAALPLWWSIGADHTRGGYFELLDEYPRPVPSGRRLRVQARQAYTYATAGRTGWKGPWRTAAEWGLRYLDSAYLRPDGLYRKLVDDNGQPVDDGVQLYDQAFVLLALSAAENAQLAPAGVYTARARVLLDIVERQFSHPSGGLCEEASQGSTFHSNPHMHLFEAALEWEIVDRDGPWGNVADRIADLCLRLFIDHRSGALREFFEADGTPARGKAGQLLSPGHQFEWAALLARWGERRRCNLHAVIHRLYEIGKHGHDAKRNVIIDEISDEMKPLTLRARLWPQAEWARAALKLSRLAVTSDQGAVYEMDALQASRGTWMYLDRAAAGLWHDKLRSDGTFVAEPSPASSLYHITNLVKDLENLL
jgi:mannose-6-phosphate isomerase